MKLPSTPWFTKREDWQRPTTPADSPFRQFNVHCLKCGSYKLRLLAEWNEDANEAKVYLFCTRCRERELLPVR